ncbi:aryl-sulfate sulfotransferase [Formosa sp. PL04]|uniref:aryl-sulfate sulfotransferase n=1 Tax=Formosa sp. PL04 TaxID=3081755 RepID=UPI0029815607|nr:aryl-sulfate sulfotransferase [Formosa sp. PL04]MDW5288730.1 aryl-sulfate sulfotransferase [Formosa sp. PL04]
MYSKLKNKYPKFLVLIGVFLCISCQNDNDFNSEEEADIPCNGAICDMLIAEEIILNPTGYAPLSAIIALETNESIQVDISIAGSNGTDSNVVHQFSETGTTLDIPIHGLYPDYENTVTLSFFNTNGLKLGEKSYVITTDPLITDLPQISIDTADRNLMESGMNLVNYFGYDQHLTLFRPFIFDSYGDIRWYLNFENHPILSALDYDNGPEQLANGNLYFADQSTNAIYEIDLFGTILNIWEISGYKFHHEVFEKPNGNFLVTVDKNGENTIEDYIIEIDRHSKEIVVEWNLNASLDNTRMALTSNTQDWIHVNAINYDETDNTIIVSGRTQGVIKLNNNNEVVWIMGSHSDWNTSGNGIALNPFLLQPLDASGLPITDQAVLNGHENHPDFEWNWFQHATKVLPNGNIILFDNGGTDRNFSTTDLYSRAVEFKIENGTIQQVWDYGKERGLEIYSRIVSDVDYLENQDHILMSSGAIVSGTQPVGKLIEIDMSDHNVIFEATITPPTAHIDQITFHRAGRISLYSN